MRRSVHAGRHPLGDRSIPVAPILAALLLLPVLSPAKAQPVPFARLARDGGGLQSWAGIHANLRGLAAAYPEMSRLQVIGRSSQGRQLLALRVADDPADMTRPTILLTAAHHANEAATPEHVIDAARVMLERHADEPFATWLGSAALVVVPMVNPDGSAAFWERDARLGRKNSGQVYAGRAHAGVDLNRNYPFRWAGSETRFSSRDPRSRFYRGPGPASEPEVRAMIRLAEQVRPAAMISYHSAAARLLVPYAIPGTENPRPSAAWSVADLLLDRLPHAFGHRRFSAAGSLYPVTGVEKDWYHYRFGTLAYLVELPYRRPQGNRLTESVEETRGAWQALFERWVSGPSLSLRAVEYGVPVEVGVQLDEIETRAGEHWTTGPEHGWFHLYLPAPGVYTVRLTSDRAEVVRSIRVDGLATVQVDMTTPVSALAQAAW